VIGIEEVQWVPGLEIEALEGTALLSVRGEVLGARALTFALVMVPDHGELIGVGIGERREEGSPDDAEDGDVGANAEGEREDGDGGEAFVAGQHAQAKADITTPVAHVRIPPDQGYAAI
jgi:hypothetical protein